MVEEDEFEILLGEIPYATLPVNHETKKISNGTMYGMYDNEPSSVFNYRTCESPVSGFSLPSDVSSSSFLSNTNSHDHASPPLFEENFSRENSRYSRVLPNVLNVGEKSVGSIECGNLVSDDVMLSDRMSKFCISDENCLRDYKRFQPLDRSMCGAKYDTFGYGSGFDPNRFHFANDSIGGAKRYNVENVGNLDYGERVFSESLPPYVNGIQFRNHSVYGAGSISEGKYGNFDCNGRGFSNYGVPQSAGTHNGYASSAFPGRFSGMSCPTNSYNFPHYITNGTYLDYSKDKRYSALLGDYPNRMNMNEDMGHLNMYNMPHNAQWPHSKVESELNGWNRGASNFRGPQGGFGVSSVSDDSLIIGVEGLKFVKKKENERLRDFNHKGFYPLHDMSLENPRGKSLHPRLCSSIIPPLKYESLVEVRGYIHMIAKDQDGCRFLQKIFEEGTPQDIEIVFNEIIGHVVELMVDPFGNYLMQKLLEVCSEEQRKQILLMLTETPGQLIRISLNTHGTRVVQKLIETLKNRQHVSLVISALEPGFLALIKDLNGNHVIKQCLQSLSYEDNKFIFVAASKYCVEVATHQHGCCVLQCCITLLTGKQRENLVNEISSNGMLLAEDEYGNFVIQYILELEIPSATSSLISQFEGNFVHLSTKKFSSHVVEKCLAVFDNDLRSKIIQELLSAPHFKQLLQDPYANYVIGKALKLTEGSRLYNVLLEAIQCHESILRNCPYSKKLLSAIRQYRGTTGSRNSLPGSF